VVGKNGHRIGSKASTKMWEWDVREQGAWGSVPDLKGVAVIQLLADVRTWFENLRSDERGATAVEYGLLVALIAAVIILVVTTLGGQIRDAFQSIVDNL
jgi:pilus assembly protein Flp/PilA